MIEIEEVADGIWRIGKLYVVERSSLYSRCFMVLTPTGPITKPTRREAFGFAVCEAMDT